MDFWFTSDEHYDHKNIIQYCNRPFRDVDHQIEELISRHNSVVKDGDVVWHLGDFSLNEKTIPKVLPRLHGMHVIVVGNHDRCHMSHKGYKKAEERYWKHFKWVFTNTVRLPSFILDHFPYVGDSRHEQRYSEYRPEDKGDWLLHGHIHELWKTNGRMINVGVDVWDYTPVSYETLLEIKNRASG